MHLSSFSHFLSISLSRWNPLPLASLFPYQLYSPMLPLGGGGEKSPTPAQSRAIEVFELSRLRESYSALLSPPITEEQKLQHIVYAIKRKHLAALPSLISSDLLAKAKLIAKGNHRPLLRCQRSSAMSQFPRSDHTTHWSSRKINQTQLGSSQSLQLWVGSFLKQSSLLQRLQS